MPRHFLAPAPFGFVTLADAVTVASKVTKGDRDRAKAIVAEGCEAGRILAVYKTITGVADLDRSVWHGHWPSYFNSGTIDLDLPVLINGKPATHGRTVLCTREIYIRKESLETLIAEELEPVPTVAKRYPGDAALIEEGRQMISKGMQKRAAARELAPRAEGAGTLESKVDRLRRAF